MVENHKTKKSRSILKELENSMVGFIENNRHVRVMGGNMVSIFNILLKNIILPKSKKGTKLTESEIKEIYFRYIYCKTALFTMLQMNAELLEDEMEKLEEDINNLIDLNDINITKKDGKKFCDTPAAISLDFEADYSYLEDRWYECLRKIKNVV